MREKRTYKKPRQTQAEWTVEPLRPVEREDIVEQLRLILDAMRRRILAPERLIQ
jgi:hypothetical protein